MLKTFAIRSFGWLADKYAPTFTFLKEALPKADLKISLRCYLSIVFFFSILVYFASLFATLLTFFALPLIKISILLKIAYAIFLPFLMAAFSFIFLILYPMHRMMRRARNIEVNLPFVLTHMGAIAQSGVPPYIIFRLISAFKEYGEVAKEMEKIVRNIEVFGMDPVTAVEEVAKRTPSENFKQILLGFVSTTKAGGDVKLYLRNAGQQALFEWKMRRERFLQQLSAYAEFYTGILIAAPLFIIALFAVMNMIQPTMMGFDILFLTQVSIYVIVPVLNLGFLMFLKGVEVEM